MTQSGLHFKAVFVGKSSLQKLLSERGEEAERIVVCGAHCCWDQLTEGYSLEGCYYMFPTWGRHTLENTHIDTGPRVLRACASIHACTLAVLSCEGLLW